MYSSWRQRTDPHADSFASEFQNPRYFDHVGYDRRRTVLLHGGSLAFALGGKDASEFKRIAVGEQMRRIADSVLKVNPATKIVAMGDFNDDPTDPSMLEGLNAKPKVKDLQPGDFFSPFHAVLRAGMGTLAYGDAWNLFDNIVVSENLVNAKPGELRLVRAPGSKYYGNVFKRNYMIQREGQFKGYPLRTYVGNNFQGGYSDHFPVYIYIGK